MVPSTVIVLYMVSASPSLYGTNPPAHPSKVFVVTVGLFASPVYTVISLLSG
jgi:hypothetical protein